MRNPFRRRSWIFHARRRVVAGSVAAWTWIVAAASAVWVWLVAAAAAVWSWIVRAWLFLSGELKRRATIARLRRADIILASPRTLRLSPVALLYRLILRARYVHSMLYLGDQMIIHTTMRAGVTVGSLPRKIHREDRYVILRARELGPRERGQVVTAALRLKDTKLDRAGLVSNVPARLLGLRQPLVRFERNRLWCSKLIYHAYSEAGIDLVPDANIETITSEDLSRSPRLERI